MYVISPDGWKDIEMTGYVKLESFSFDEEFAWAARSGKHTASDPCDGTAYFGALGFSDRAWFQKKIFHGEGYTGKRYSTQTAEPLQHRWVGIKMMTYNIDQGIKLELWVDDKADNNWLKVAETTDSGGWSNKVEYCGRELSRDLGDKTACDVQGRQRDFRVQEPEREGNRADMQLRHDPVLHLG
jgi:hypothetical protein